jgi:hypothetical protein
MNLDYETLDLLRQNHPAWRLLRSDNAAFVAAFLQRAFLTPNKRVMPQADLAEVLEDALFGLRARLGPQTFPKPAIDYLNDWADPARGYVRKFYPADSDEPHFDLTPPTEKAIAWLETLNQRSFVGTESRLLTLFDLLKQLSEGSETDPAARLAGLQKRRDEVDAEIARVINGDFSVLDDTAIKDRFQQVTQLARDLLTDFREVEQNFRSLDRSVRERIALWNGAKGDLLQEIMGARDVIADSDQGRSFRAFWDFLMSANRQEEFSSLLQRILDLAPVAALRPDPRLSRVHYDWLEAGELTQRMVAQLSQQLRRFLDDQAWLENRRIMEILHNIESRALALRDSSMPDAVMDIPDTAASIELPMERPLYSPSVKPHISDMALESGDSAIDASALYAQAVVDKARLAGNIRHALRTRSQVNLAELCRLQPLHHGLAELVAYLQLASDDFKSVVNEEMVDTVGWERTGPTGLRQTMQAKIPRVIFLA